jgi:glycerol uptake facilitator-like aquaporin
MNSGDDAKPPAGRIIAAIIFALLAIAFFVVGVILEITPDNHLPGFLGHSASDHRHALRGVGSILVGLVFTVSAWFALRYQSPALEEAREAGSQPKP